MQKNCTGADVRPQPSVAICTASDTSVHMQIDAYDSRVLCIQSTPIYSTSPYTNDLHNFATPARALGPSPLLRCAYHLFPPLSLARPPMPLSVQWGENTEKNER
ncbi:hypothetical protein BV20DRAFT_731484 [Pilatotrama ljubarskyi]|nr:hypothetical protein BV20DRAFT_731484 [Pilatotrama ljubarskyi]